MTFTTQIIKGFKWTLAIQVLSQIANWAITIFVIRLLSPDDYGIYAIAITITAFLVQCGEFGIANALIQKNNFDKILLKKVFGFVLLIHVLFFLLLYLSAQYISAFYGIDALRSVLQVQAVQFLMLSLTVIPDAKMRNEMRFKLLSIVTFSTAIFGGLMTLVLAYMDFGYWALVWGNFARIFSLVIFLHSVSPSILMPNFNFKNMSGVGKFGGIVVLNRLLFHLYSKSDILIIGKVLSSSTTGLYNVAKDLATLPMAKIASSINIVAFSAFSKYEDRGLVAKHYIKATSVLSMISFPVFVGISSVSPELVPTVLGDRWTGLIMTLQLIAVAVPFRVLNIIHGPLLDGLGSPEKSLKNTIIALAVYVPAFIFCSRWGAEGMAMAWVVLTPLYYALIVYRVRDEVPFRMSELLLEILPPLIFSIVMFISVRSISYIINHYLMIDGIFLLIMEIMAGCLVYVSLIYFLQKSRFTELLLLVKR